MINDVTNWTVAAKLLEAERAAAIAVTGGIEEAPVAGQPARNVRW